MSIAQPTTSARCRRGGRARCAARRADAAARTPRSISSAADPDAAAPDRVVQAPAVRQQERALRADARRAADAPGPGARTGLARAARATAPASSRCPRTRGASRAATSPTTARARRSSTTARCRCVTIEVPNPEAQGPGARSIRGRRREDQPPPGAAPGQLRGAEVRAPGDQAPRHADAALPAGAGGRHRGQPRRRELRRRAAGRQVRVAPAAVPPAPAADRGGLQAQPAVADAAGAARRAAARGRSTRRSSPRSAPAASRRWTRRRSRPGAPGRAR